MSVCYNSMGPFISLLQTRMLNKLVNRNIITRVISTSNVKDGKMPKHVKEIRETRLQKQKENHTRQQNVPAVTYIQVMGSGSLGSPRSLHVFTDHKTYLFNCGEGTQRMAHEHKIKLSKLGHVFVTYNSWENTGGLLGLTLTVQDIGVPRIHLHGPPETENIFHMSKGFLIVNYTKIGKNEYWEKTFEDGALKVLYVPLFGSKIIRPNSSSSNSRDDEYNNDQFDSKEKKRTLSPPYEESSMKKRNKQAENDISVAYICKLHNKPGELNMKKCKEFGVPVGPLLGKLKQGHDITLPEGTIVKSADVVSPEEPGPVFIVIECPSEDFLDSLLMADAFVSHQSSATSEKDFAELVVHFTPANIMHDPRYKEWMNRFPSQTQHLVLNDSYHGLSSAGSSKIQHKLNLVHPEIFPLLEYEKEIVPHVESVEQNDSPSLIMAEPLIQYYFRPHLRYQRNFILTLDPDAFKSDVETIPECVEKLSELKATISKIPLLSEKYPEITFLGTGSSIPSKARNVSGILLTLSSQKNILLDCGEGTYSQLLKLYGSDATLKILKNLSAVYVSHLHADHHLGLLKIIFERRKAFHILNETFRPFILLAPDRLEEWLNAYSDNVKTIANDFISIPLHTCWEKKEITNDNYNNFLAEAGLKMIVTTPVLHCKFAYGVAIILCDGRKIVYSGDTRPCEELVKIGKNCDVLIHEATMEDDLVKEARLKLHSTTSQAIEIGKRMEAKFTILTHFSQRYAKIPLFNENFHNTVGVAFDNMKLSWNHLPLIPHFIPVLKLIFSEDYEQMEELKVKKMRRQMQEESVKEVPVSSLKITS